MARLRIQYSVLTRVTRQYGSRPTSDLLGVDYYQTVPADTEFPCRLGTRVLFVRFVAAGRYGGRVRVTVTRLHPDGTDRDRVYSRAFGLPAGQAAGSDVFDLGLRLENIVVPGEGVYAVRVSRRARPRWGGPARRRVLSREYFEIQRAP